MKYGFVFPGGEARSLAELAHEAEAAGWDGAFIPDCIFIDAPEVGDELGFDPWVTLAAMAMRTERIGLGTMITPPSRRRPWKLAREVATLDRLSNGRMILPVGLGALDDAGFGHVGEATDRKTRARMMDESLAILDGLWSGERFSFSGEHYRVTDLRFIPTPVQRPRVPIWVVAAWPRERSMARAVRWDGIVPQRMNADGSGDRMTPDDIRAMAAYIRERRGDHSGPFDIIIEGRTPGDARDRARSLVQPYAEAGATWWMDAMWSAPNSFEDVRARVRQGPPRV